MRLILEVTLEWAIKRGNGQRGVRMACPCTPHMGRGSIKFTTAGDAILLSAEHLISSELTSLKRFLARYETWLVLSRTILGFYVGLHAMQCFLQYVYYTVQSRIDFFSNLTISVNTINQARVTTVRLTTLRFTNNRFTNFGFTNFSFTSKVHQ